MFKIEKVVDAILIATNAECYKIEFPQKANRAMFNSLQKYIGGYQTQGIEKIIVDELQMEKALYYANFLGEKFQLTALMQIRDNQVYIYLYQFKTEISPDPGSA